MVSPTRVSATSLIAAVMKPISPGPSSSTCVHLRREETDALDVVGGAGAHHADAAALLHRAVDDADQNDDAEIDVVPAIDQQRLQRRVAVALRRRQARDDGFQHVGHAKAGLGRDHHGIRRVDADHVLDLLPYLLGFGRGQVDLVENRYDLMARIERVVDVGERLRFDALAGVDHQQRPFAGRQRPRDFVGEVDMAGRVHQVEDVILAVLGAVVQPHRLRLDGDAALALDIHGIEHLLLARHFAVRQPARHLDQAVGQRRFAMVDMGDDGEVADVGNGGSCHGARDSIHIPVRQPYCCISRGFLHAKLIPLGPKTRYARGHVDCIHFAHGRARQAHSLDPAARRHGWPRAPAIPKPACGWSPALPRFMPCCGR